MKGKLFAISGPSGVGKNSVLNRVMQLRDRVQYSISATSRPMRPGEIDGKSYYFVTREQFEQMIAAGELLEHAEYVGNYYGTPLKPIQAALAAGTDVVMDVDVVGALNIKKRLPEAVLVFMAAPSMAEIRRRLASRGDVSPELMEKRMDRAKWEYSQAGQYDYLVVNDTVEHAAQELLAIMTAESVNDGSHPLHKGGTLMLYPAMSELLKNVDSRYLLVNVVAHRARQLSIESELTHEPLEEKPVTLAIREVAAGQLKAELDDKYRH